ncbi:glycosyltransferase family 9 protein [Alteromonas sp. CYL-A6]|uniref:glycosyltransferase family 9 protein n=1 Tax=Alteromonas nitratireducens TaxID=3390813 RepID=UPI0034BF0D93
MSKKICLMRLSAIGDVCHAVAMVNRIQQHWRDAALTWVIGKVEYQLVKQMPGIRFVIFDKSKGKAAVEALKQELGNEEFDALLMMQVALRANMASRVIKARRRIGFDWHRSKELHWLFANERVAAHPQAHVLDGFMDFADKLGVPPVDAPAWDIPVSDEDDAWAQAQAEELGPFVVISPAASKKERNWLPERYASIANYLSNKGKSVILCGGPGALDRQTASDIKACNPQLAKDYTGQTSLHQLLALLKRAELVIAPDTGPAHMATTVGTPVIGLYAHSNPRRTGPYNNIDNVVSVYDECIEEQKGKPWQSLPWGTRAKGATLMARIPESRVIEQIDNLLKDETPLR